MTPSHPHESTPPPAAGGTATRTGSTTGTAEEDRARPVRRPRPAQAAGWATARFISRLQRQYLDDNAGAVATLARLRRGVGRQVHEDPHGWASEALEQLAAEHAWSVENAGSTRRAEQTTSGGGYAPGPDSAAGGGPEPQPLQDSVTQYGWEDAERAVHVAVTLWALHQQSGNHPMYRHPQTLGSAVRALGHARGRKDTAAAEAATPGTAKDASTDEVLDETLRKRFVRIGTSTSLDMLTVRLRELVLLLRSSGVPLDYARLAAQLCTWQDERKRALVRRSWGREFHLAFGDDAARARSSAPDPVEATGLVPEPNASDAGAWDFPPEGRAGE